MVGAGTEGGVVLSELRIKIKRSHSHRSVTTTLSGWPIRHVKGEPSNQGFERLAGRLAAFVRNDFIGAKLQEMRLN